MLGMFQALWRTFLAVCTTREKQRDVQPARSKPRFEQPLQTTAPATQPEPLSANEPLTRFVTDRDHFDKPPGKVHWRAFRPKSEESELSIARIHDLAIGEIWNLGQEMAGTPSGRTVVGRADFLLSHVRAARLNSSALDVVPDEPPRRHALIIGWPSDRDARKLLSMLLASDATQSVRSG